LHYGVEDQTELFRSTLVLDQTTDRIVQINFGLRPNYGLILHLRPKFSQTEHLNTCCHLKHLWKYSWKFDLFYLFFIKSSNV